LRSAVRKTLGQQEGDGGPKRIARYKRIGELIDSHVLLHAERATYGSEVIQRLSGDLAVGYQRLYEMLNVYRAYPIFRSTGNLSWTHYVTLATIEDGQVRAAYEAQAVRGAWSGRELRDRIKEGLLQDADGHLVADWNGSLPPTPRRGQPYTYRVKEARSNSLLLDLGMGAEHEIDLKRPTPFEAGDVVTTQSDGKLYTIQPGDSRRLYTFKASVERVVDGDTFWVKVDYGFKFRARENTPPWHRFGGVVHRGRGTREGLGGRTTERSPFRRDYDDEGGDVWSLYRGCVLRWRTKRWDGGGAGALPERGDG
jgi:hypothetical protein